MYNTSTAVTVLTSITQDEVDAYKNDWKLIEPQDYLETFRRWLFAFCSVHTTWQSNVRSYNNIKDWLQWWQKADELEARLVSAKAGLHKQRTGYISLFCTDYWKNPWDFYKQDNESWFNYRNRLVSRIHGLGMAKVSFAIELMYPLTAHVVCLDTHMFRLYGLDAKKDRSFYHSVECHWVDGCTQLTIPPVLARAIYWDKKQKQPNSNYWTYVFNS